MPNLTIDELESWIDDFVVAEPRSAELAWAMDHS